MANTRETEAVLLAFLAGATLGAGIALLLTPKSGKEVRGKLGDVTGGAMQKLKDSVHEAKFKMSRRTNADAFSYDGGDYFV
jgi:gas vesicle protein